VAARPAVWAPQRGEERQMLEALKSLGITHILIDKTKLGDLLGYNLAIVQPEVINTWYVKEYEDTTYILYRLLQQ
jgi:hypothetical protein